LITGQEPALAAPPSIGSCKVPASASCRYASPPRLESRRNLMIRKREPFVLRAAALALAVLSLPGLTSVARSARVSPAGQVGIVRETLPNGLHVIVVRNTLAPVVATAVNYLVGSDEAPAEFPGMAHALEHMMFRGSPGLTADQLANIGSVMGGNFNANTRE